MYKLVFLIIFFNSALFAHECILQSNTPFDIQSYNLCKNDLKNSTSGHEKEKNNSQLIEENIKLKYKLKILKEKIFEIQKELAK